MNESGALTCFHDRYILEFTKRQSVNSTSTATCHGRVSRNTLLHVVRVVGRHEVVMRGRLRGGVRPTGAHRSEARGAHASSARYRGTVETPDHEGGGGV